MWYRVEIESAGRCSAHGGDGKNALAVSFGGGRGNSGDKLEMYRSSVKYVRGQGLLCQREKESIHRLPIKRRGSRTRLRSKVT